ncbi:GntR family transcriptional regulator [Paracoccus saliphilus]|uniref:GntR family transcriptional regulator n=1 Tax=Paracoccus saliphilus TaxID=405559 RepID=A0AA45W694_9RHOB|nr:GntR family transcriptional regulator [Paracoccus saliphilus]WCR01503.1 GntR family transcriptional regulator [Paracoccus saliphilus]SIS99548.1 transcriptional regulator, GntR family [Paracoccus saliphilus]
MTISSSAKGQRLRVPRPTSLRDHVQETLRSSILNGEFQLGEHLVERELCEAMGVSRPLLREALVHLEARGLIDRIPARGFVVAQPSIDRVAALYELRSALEGLAAQFFAERGAEADITSLKARFGELRALIDKPELSSVRAATSAFYDILMDRCGNPEIRTVLEPVLDRIAFLRTQSMTRPGRLGQSVAEIGKIVQAIEARNVDAARIASEAHIAAAAESALIRLRDFPQD